MRNAFSSLLTGKVQYQGVVITAVHISDHATEIVGKAAAVGGGAVAVIRRAAHASGTRLGLLAKTVFVCVCLIMSVYDDVECM